MIWIRQSVTYKIAHKNESITFSGPALENVRKG